MSHGFLNSELAIPMIALILHRSKVSFQCSIQFGMYVKCIQDNSLSQIKFYIIIIFFIART